MSLLFTYGTLQRNQRNNWRLYNSRFLGRATVQGRLYQFRGPGMDFPILRRHPERLVHGELYEVSQTVLEVQDWCEMLYKRVKVLAFPETYLQLGTNTRPLSCWVYEGLNTLPYSWARKLKTGRWPS